MLKKATQKSPNGLSVPDTTRLQKVQDTHKRMSNLSWNLTQVILNIDQTKILIHTNYDVFV